MPISWVGTTTEIGCPPSPELSLALATWLGHALGRYSVSDRILLARVLSLAVPAGGSQGASIRRTMAADIIRHQHIVAGGSWSLEEAAGRESRDPWTY